MHEYLDRFKKAGRERVRRSGGFYRPARRLGGGRREMGSGAGHYHRQGERNTRPQGRGHPRGNGGHTHAVSHSG